MAGPAYTFRLAKMADQARIIHFMNTHWEVRHPLVNLPDFFDYYYVKKPNSLHFALAEEGDALAAIAGYIPASNQPGADVWVSIWVADKTARGSGLELMAALPQLTGCRTLACNNIRPATRSFYEFLGYTTGRVGHFYRLANRQKYTVARVAQREIPPVSGPLQLVPLPSAQALAQSGFIPSKDANPYKDLWYITRRYYHFPRQQYSVWGVCQKAGAAPLALLVTRHVPVLDTAVIRIVDYIGEAALLPALGTALEGLLCAGRAEYMDFYCTGLPAGLLWQAGFAQREEESPNIIPNYLTPLLAENTEYYYFTNRPQGFCLFKADGDQDRPNIVI